MNDRSAVYYTARRGQKSPEGDPHRLQLLREANTAHAARMAAFACSFSTESVELGGVQTREVIMGFLHL